MKSTKTNKKQQAAEKRIKQIKKQIGCQTARYSFFDKGKFKSYVKADVGYSYNSGNFDDDIYYGAGLGIQYSKITWDIMYKRNNSSHNNSEYYKDKFDYDRLSLSSGFIFDF